ncbi:CDF family Co(II)/Ni(II) efflux transporter DmeF [Ciceribacter sp. L1K23]|uniref:CDF family Co(II)/Ni(II) efflux transporter DmeF n=1 Tax=Ciceribacter sp. L1K23 TaxID=2820276 RepID=UPI001B843D56|nr:CDF family Co(II)/Ni(II) efflux transporter DmeF [Ciceribacter sp. L1K23]MBR0556508.1 CDF family Co(II)/Ni(II) efflux transporter DmeF [Ciceribacter sp. L1K23]
MTEASPRHASPHDHVFLGKDHGRNERRTWFVIALTAVTMVVEIVAGTVFGSMALVADGWHMSTHAAAMLVAALAYMYARRNADNPRFTFGTGKFGDLAAFASAILLALVAALIAWESLMRFRNPVAIDFSQAMIVAVLGLIVNLVSAWLLHGGAHHHGHDHHHHHDHGEHHHHDHGHHAHAADNNLRAAYLHVLADALTSVLAIVALVFGALYGWSALDPLMGIVGAAVILRWSVGLIRQSGAILLDYVGVDDGLPAEIREAIEGEGGTVTDLHIWRLGPGHHGAIVSITSQEARDTDYYRRKLSHIHEISHLTIEIDRAA